MKREMKESGITWIGDIPKHWNVVKVKNKYTHNKEIVGDRVDEFERLSLTLNGVLKRPKDDTEGLQPEKFEGYQILRENQLVFKLIDLENVRTSRVGLSPYTGLVSPAYIILDNKSESRYGYYYFLSMWQREIFNKLGGEGVRSNLNTKDLLRIPYIDVPLNEKDKIVKYLDEKVTNINQIILDTSKTIEEYKNYKNSIITEIVMQGVHRNHKLKESGIDYIGNMPESWKLIKLKNIVTKLNREIEPNSEVVICSNSGQVILRGDKRIGLISESEVGYQGVKAGDLLIHGMDTWHGAIAVSGYDGKCTPVVHVCDSTNNKKYIAYYLRALAFKKVYKAISNGVRENTSDFRSWSKAGNIVIAIPSILEQNDIVEYLDKKCNEIDILISKKEALIEQMNEYKKSLIYECVTGKKEI